jgi:hypothetical protein
MLKEMFYCKSKFTQEFSGSEKALTVKRIASGKVTHSICPKQISGGILLFLLLLLFGGAGEGSGSLHLLVRCSTIEAHPPGPEIIFVMLLQRCASSICLSQNHRES